MKNIITASVVIVLGLLITLGPQLIFKVCSPSMMTSEATTGGCGCSGGSSISYPACHWSAQALVGIGMLIAALGLCLIVFKESKVQLGLTIGIFFSSIIALFIPNALIGGCGMMTMACRKTAFPVISIIGIVLLIASAIYMIILYKDSSANNAKN